MEKGFIDFIEVGNGIYLINYSDVLEEGEFVNSEFVRAKLNSKNYKIMIFDHNYQEKWKNFQ